MDFFVLHPESDKIEKVLYSDIDEFGKMEAEHSEFEDYRPVTDFAYEKGKEYRSALLDMQGTPFLLSAVMEKDSDLLLIMLTQPNAYESHAGIQDMEQNVCLNGETIGTPGVFMNGEFVFGTIGFVNMNVKTGNYESVTDENKSLIKEFMKNTLVKNASRHNRDNEKMCEKVDGLMIKNGSIVSVSVKGHWTLKDKLGVRSHDDIYRRKYDDEHVIYYADGNRDNVFIKGNMYKGPVVIVGYDKNEGICSMSADEKKEFRKLLRDGLVKNDMKIISEVSKGKEIGLKK